MRGAIAPLVVALLAACTADDETKPYVEFLGGGFVFNYRLAEADYGFVVKRVRRIPDGTLLEARFENPAGGEPLLVTQPARWGRLEYVFRSPPVSGVEAGRDYRVELRLVESASGRVLARYARTYRADVGEDVLPPRPPVTGPGYQRSPAG
ncbi:MAG: hypothetical protein R3286_19350 [Gammaproteobacteria bacterium]|nr:hypothetical protein [Gammaproteobacteria bacterium]